MYIEKKRSKSTLPSFALSSLSLFLPFSSLSFFLSLFLPFSSLSFFLSFSSSFSFSLGGHCPPFLVVFLSLFLSFLLFFFLVLAYLCGHKHSPLPEQRHGK